MRRALPLAVLLALLCVAPGRGQNPPPAKGMNPAEADAVVRGWYRRFLEREPRAWEVETWAQALRSGDDSTEFILSRMLGGAGYYQRAGGTPEGFVRALYLDVLGREPTREEAADWVRQLRNSERDQVALAFLRGKTPTWMPPAKAEERRFFDDVHEAASRLSLMIEQLQQDLVVELSGRKEDALYRRGDEVLQDLREFRRTLRPGAPRGDLYGSFDRMDRKLHKLLDDVQALGAGGLQRAANRVAAADDQLHAALSAGDTSEDRGREVLRRRARALGSLAAEFQKTAEFALQGQGGRRVREAAAAFREPADHFGKAAEAEADRGHLRRDFAQVEAAWAPLAEAVNQLTPPQGNGYLRSQAEQLDALMAQIHRQLEMEGERPGVVPRLGPPQ